MSTNSAPQAPPWYESNLLWGPGALGVGILLTVVATKKADLRWLLWLALPCFLLACWIVVKQIRPPKLRRIMAAICFLVICGGFFWMNARLRPASSASANNGPVQSQSDKPADAKPEEKKPDKKDQATKKSEPKPKPKVEQPAQDIHVGDVTSGPCSNTQIGGSGNTATTNCGSSVIVTYNYAGTIKKVVSGGTATAMGDSSPQDAHVKIGKELRSGQSSEALADAQNLMAA